MVFFEFFDFVWNKNQVYLKNLETSYYIYGGYYDFNDFCMEQKSISRLLNDQFNKKYGGKKLWTL